MKKKEWLETLKLENTFRFVALEWHQLRQAGRGGECHANDVIQKLTKDVFPAIGDGWHCSAEQVAVPGGAEQHPEARVLEQAKRTLALDCPGDGRRRVPGPMRLQPSDKREEGRVGQANG